jgi:hypothetical protein
VNPVPDPLLLRKSGRTGNQTQELWPLDNRGGHIGAETKWLSGCGSVSGVCNTNFCLQSHAQIDTGAHPVFYFFPDVKLTEVYRSPLSVVKDVPLTLINFSAENKELKVIQDSWKWEWPASVAPLSSIHVAGWFSDNSLEFCSYDVWADLECWPDCHLSSVTIAGDFARSPQEMLG